jgi:hypothetical protein
MNYLKPNQQRSKTAIILILIIMALDIIGLISNVFEYLLLEKAAEFGISPDEAYANDLRQRIIGILYLIAFITSIVTFILWFRRAYANLTLAYGKLNHDEGWAAGAWFVPILSLYRPYQMMKELYQKTAALLNEKLHAYYIEFTFLGLWWTLWIVGNVVGNISTRYALRAETIDELTISSIINIVSDFVAIISALLTVKVIRDYSKMENLLTEINFNEEPDAPAALAIEVAE